MFSAGSQVSQSQSVHGHGRRVGEVLYIFLFNSIYLTNRTTNTPVSMTLATDKRLELPDNLDASVLSSALLNMSSKARMSVEGSHGFLRSIS